MPLITNVMGSTAAEVCALVEAVGARDEVAAIELNVSCPNVKTGLDIGADPAVLGAMLAEVRPRTTKPLIVKLTPNTADVALVAEAAEAAGADAVSLINTLRAYAAHPARAREPWLGDGDRRPVGPGDPRGRAGAGARGRRAGRRCRSSAWAASPARATRANLLDAGAIAGRRRHRELPRSGDRGAESPQNSRKSPQRAGTSSAELHNRRNVLRKRPCKMSQNRQAA